MGGSYKQESQNLFQQMPLAKQRAFLQQLKSIYRQILLNYFTNDITGKQKIDTFINIVLELMYLCLKLLKSIWS